jgi:hypothetical protein
VCEDLSELPRQRTTDKKIRAGGRLRVSWVDVERHRTVSNFRRRTARTDALVVLNEKVAPRPTVAIPERQLETLSVSSRRATDGLRNHNDSAADAVLHQPMRLRGLLQWQPRTNPDPEKSARDAVVECRCRVGQV